MKSFYIQIMYVNYEGIQNLWVDEFNFWNIKKHENN